MNEAKYTAGPRSKVPKKEIPKVHAALEEIRGRRGKLTATVVAEEVTKRSGRRRVIDERHPLAKYYDPPDQAAWNWWIVQSRELVHCIYVFYESEQPIRAYSSVVQFVPERKKREYVFLPTLEALVDDRNREQLFNNALAEIDSWQRRYEALRRYYALIRRIYRSNKRILENRKRHGHRRGSK